MIDIATEHLITPADACSEPGLRNEKTKKPCHRAKFYRCVLRGCRSVSGHRIRLEVFNLPSGLVTSKEAVRRFILKLNDPTAIDQPQKLKQVASVDAACAELAAAGLA